MAEPVDHGGQTAGRSILHEVQVTALALSRMGGRGDAPFEHRRPCGEDGRNHRAHFRIVMTVPRPISD